MARKTYRKVITDPEIINQINPENLRLKKAFLKEKGFRSSEKTIIGYDSDLQIFLCWNVLENNNKIFPSLRKIELSNFFGFCIEELKFGSARYGRLKSCLSSFSNFIEKFEDDTYPQFKNIVLRAVESMPKNPTREKTILSEEQIKFIFDSLEKENEKQISCWLALAIASGCRFAELLRFSTDLIDENNTAFDGIFLETTKAIKTKGRTKTGKMLVKYIIKDIFWDKYNIWLEERQKILDKTGQNHNFIFIKKDGSQADEATARSWVSKVQKFVDAPFYCHCLRHYAVSFLSRKKISPELIKSLFGWEDLSMVFLYDDVKIQDKEFPELENLKIKPEADPSK
jgi:site-specific recombinase XerD